MVKRPMLRMNRSAVYVAPGFILQGKRKFDSVDDCRKTQSDNESPLSICKSVDQQWKKSWYGIQGGCDWDMIARNLDFFIRVALKRDLLLLHISYFGRILLPLVQHSFPLSLTSWVMFICIPILFGCQTKLKPEPNQAPQICPHCHNASVFPTKKNTWFELFFVPIIPLSRKHILLCMICGWQAALINHDQAPAIASANKPRGVQGWDVPNQTGYQPAYIPCPQK